MRLLGDTIKNILHAELIDMIVTYTYLGDDDKALSATEHFQNLLNSSDQHRDCLCKDESYVSGPDKEPAPGWCPQTVNSTANFVKDLVKESLLRQHTKDSIDYVIEQMRNAGLRCCANGEPWKGCVGPLARRAVEWQATGVPEDPKWN